VPSGTPLIGVNMAYTKFLRNFDANGVWTKDSRQIRVEENGKIVEVDMDEYAKKHGIELPDSKKFKKQINKDIEEKSYGDLGQTSDEGSAEEHGNGDSEGSE